MSKSKGMSFVSNIAAKVKKRPTDQSSGSPSGRWRSYLPQVQEKIDNLERKEKLQQSSIDTQEPPEPHRSLQNASPPQNGFSSLPTEDPIIESTDSNGCHQSLKIAPLLHSLKSIHEQSTGAERGEREINLAEHLTNPEEIMSSYFGQMIKDCTATGSDDAFHNSAAQHGLVTSHEPFLTADTHDHQLNRVFNLPLKLTLTPLSRGGTITSRFVSILEAEYGPLHAALQVGNVVLEWDDSSLVIPRVTESDIGGLQSRIPHRNEWVEISVGRNTGMRLAAERRGFHEEIELVYFVDSASVQDINALVDAVVKYNSILYHHVIRRNCQHFVVDVLKALRVERPITLTQGLTEYYKALKEGRSKSTPDKFQSHSELDLYVKRIQQNGEIDSLTQQDLEFLLAQYLMFHLQCKNALKDNPLAVDGWRCGETECCMRELEERIKFDSLRIHNFRTQ